MKNIISTAPEEVKDREQDRRTEDHDHRVTLSEADLEFSEPAAPHVVDRADQIDRTVHHPQIEDPRHEG
jgi:hypothetical protein